MMYVYWIVKVYLIAW